MIRRLLFAIPVLFLLTITLSAQPSDAELTEALGDTYWEMQYDGNTYGYVYFYPDGTCEKESEGSDDVTEGTWSISDTQITLHYPDEGDAMTGEFTVLEEEYLEVNFMGIAWTWVLLEDDE